MLDSISRNCVLDGDINVTHVSYFSTLQIRSLLVSALRTEGHHSRHTKQIILHREEKQVFFVLPFKAQKDVGTASRGE